jgi:histidine ammonia-lyase
MTIILTTREDINLDTVFRVAWKRDTVQISDKALQRIAECRASFLHLIETEPVPVIYGVTTAMG